MTGINHGMTGAVIALSVKNPLLAVPLAFVSHFFQDALPHWDYAIKRTQRGSEGFFTRRYNLTLLTDFLVSVALMVVLGLMFPEHRWLIWSCMVAAASPDLMWAYYRLYLEHIKHISPRFDPLAKLHAFVQWSQTGPGLLVEVAWFIISGLVILRLR